MAKSQTTTAAKSQAPVISPEVQAIFNSTIGILGSKLVVDQHLNRQVELSIIGNGVALDRGAWLYNTNVTTEERLNKAIEMLSPEEFFANATNEEEARELANKALNAASISFSVPFNRGEKLTNGELVVCTVQEYDSKATGNTEIGLRFIRKERAIALERSSSALNKLAQMREMVNSEDPFSN